ncbi:MAG: hypothetical protein HQ512_05285 [Rhodospirillales bacterium]|nr:hypothetical protein [Rhodospirillales bacterium]
MNETPENPEIGSSASELADEIASLATLITQARELVADGNSIDLGALSSKVGEFCNGLAANPPKGEDATSITTMIEALVEDLNSLAQEINQQQKDQGGGTH